MVHTIIEHHNIVQNGETNVKVCKKIHFTIYGEISIALSTHQLKEEVERACSVGGSPTNGPPTLFFEVLACSTLNTSMLHVVVSLTRLHSFFYPTWALLFSVMNDINLIILVYFLFTIVE